MVEWTKGAACRRQGLSLSPSRPLGRPKLPRVLRFATLCLMAMTVVAACSSVADGAAPPTGAKSPDRASGTHQLRGGADPAQATTRPTPSSAQAAPDDRGGFRVIEVVDGDTIKIEGGQNVRLIGIDTPERGQCGYTEAAIALASLIGDRRVQLVAGAKSDKDRYGRWLRYVEVDGTDLNLEMIRSGRAIARYDSRDGYGRHPRQDLYIAADDASPNINNCAARPGSPSETDAPTRADGTSKAGPTPPSSILGSSDGVGSGADPRFSTCKEAKRNGYGPYTKGSDPEYDWYRDANKNGIVCE